MLQIVRSPQTAPTGVQQSTQPPAIMAVVRVSHRSGQLIEEQDVVIRPEGTFRFEYRHLPCGEYRYDLYVEGFHIQGQPILITA